MGALGFCIGLTGTRRKHKPFQTVEIKVKMDCDGCVRKVRNAVISMKGVNSVEVIKKESRVTITGYIDADKVLKKIRSTGKKKAEFWPYIRYNLVAYPYVVGAYDKRAPSGYVRNVANAFPAAYNRNITEDYNVVSEETLVNMFSDDNPNACSVIRAKVSKKSSMGHQNGSRTKII
ncbi:hypothetical protein V2J09_023328 [Rumex salicifolius]